jgi:hypothetical protein
LPYPKSPLEQSASIPEQEDQHFLSFNQLTQQPPLEAFIQPCQALKNCLHKSPVLTQSNEILNVSSNYSNVASDLYQPVEMPNNSFVNGIQSDLTSNFILSNLQTFDINNNEQLKQMLLLQSYMFINLILGSENKIS